MLFRVCRDERQPDRLSHRNGIRRVKSMPQGVFITLRCATAGTVHSKTAQPLTAGAWHGFPDRFDFAPATSGQVHG